MEVSTLKELEVNTKVAEVKISSAPVFHKAKKLLANGGAYGTGRRKNSVARVWIKPGKGVVTINQKDLSVYFPRECYRKMVLQPFVDTNSSGQYDVICTASGGGTTGQAGAIVHGIARALDCISQDFHSVLRKNGFLTRDSRVVERKKYGKHKARKSTQFSKR